MARQGFNMEALEILKADDIRQIISRLQALAYTAEGTTPTVTPN